MKKIKSPFLLLITFMLSLVAGCTFVEDRSAEPVSIIDARDLDSEPKIIVKKTPVKTVKNQVYFVQKGDTLGSIAYKFLGSTSAYSKIVQLNRLDPSQPIQLGQQLLIPTDTYVLPKKTLVKKTIPNSEAPAQDNLSLNSLIAAKEYKQAINLLLTRAKEQNSEQLQMKLRATVDLNVADLKAQNKSTEIERLADLLSKHPNVSTANKAYFTSIKNQVIADNYVAKAKGEEQRSNFEALYSNLKSAFEVASLAAEQNPDFIRLRDQVTERKHQSALKLYRAQKLDKALHTWQQILAIKPNDDLALVYSDRVKTIKLKLNEL